MQRTAKNLRSVGLSAAPTQRGPAVLGDLVPIGIGGSLANMASGIETVVLYLIKRRLTIVSSVTGLRSTTLVSENKEVDALDALLDLNVLEEDPLQAGDTRPLGFVP